MSQEAGGRQTSPEQRLVEAKARAIEIIAVGMEVVELTETIIGAPLAESAVKRDETPLPEGVVITPAMEKAVRAALTEIGVGMAENRGLEAAGLPEDSAVLIEGGQRHKIEAEKRLIGTGPVIFSGTKHHVVEGAERELTAHLFGLDPEMEATEFDMAHQAGETLQGYEPLKEPLAIGDVTFDGRVAKDDVFGTLVQIGTIRESTQPVYEFEVPRKYKYDDKGQPVLDAKNKHKFDQPSAGQQMVAFAHLLGFETGAICTSSTYYPSRLGELVRATYDAVSQGVDVPKIEVIAYCPSTLAEVKQENRPSIPSLAHVLGEANSTRRRLAKLQAQILEI